MEVEYIIQTDGSILVPRGNIDQNEVSSQIFKGQTTDENNLDRFFSLADESELIFGDSELCG